MRVFYNSFCWTVENVWLRINSEEQNICYLSFIKNCDELGKYVAHSLLSAPKIAAFLPLEWDLSHYFFFKKTSNVHLCDTLIVHLLKRWTTNFREIHTEFSLDKKLLYFWRTVSSLIWKTQVLSWKVFRLISKTNLLEGWSIWFENRILSNDNSLV